MDINVYGTINAQTSDGIAARAAQVKDVAMNRMQAELNQIFNAKNNVSASYANETLTITIT